MVSCFIFETTALYYELILIFCSVSNSCFIFVVIFLVCFSLIYLLLFFSYSVIGCQALIVVFSLCASPLSLATHYQPYLWVLLLTFSCITFYCTVLFFSDLLLVQSFSCFLSSSWALPPQLMMKIKVVIIAEKYTMSVFMTSGRLMLMRCCT